MKLFRPAVLLALLLCPELAAAQAKSLHWAAMEVRARLDAEGVLHVEERQDMVFNGDWNGGERRFSVRPGQRLQLQRLSRVDPATGLARALAEGDLSQVDRYAWMNGSTLRWRSRLPADPPFDNATIPYVLEYTLSGVLEKREGLYWLNHDFGFPERTGEIDRFSLDLDLDPVWLPAEGAPAHHLERRYVAPGESVIVKAGLEYHGAAEDRLVGVRTTTPARLRLAFFAAALLVMALLYASFRRRETALGRFSPPATPRDWDEPWLQENLFLYLPEEIGALWDRRIGPPEVSAVLARLVAEGKLASEVRPRRSIFGKDVLALTLTAERGAFLNYERRLVDKLFFGGRTETDTEAVRRHYQGSGFDPASEIKKDLEQRLRTHAELKGAARPVARRPTALLCLGFAALVGLDCLSRGAPSAVLALMVLFVVLWLYGPGLLAAFAWRKRTEHLDAASLGFLWPGLGVLAVCLSADFFADWFPARLFVRPGLFGDLALALLPVALWNSLLNNARTREAEPAIHRRQILAAARRMLRRELGERQPRLRDEWLPYVLAFGLQRDMDRWFRAFGGVRSGGGSALSSPAASSSPSVSSGGGGWTGGGGAFGGAGASTSWAAAAGGLAAGVAAPSSSGGGGGGGGGSSSGGGGGGGW
jgi:uncharacterized membrane protein YgcG